MLRTLKLIAVPVDGKNCVPVHWHLQDGESAPIWQGICEVEIPPSAPFSIGVAEIHAFHYLLTERRIFGPQTVPYNGRVVVSCPDIPKLITETCKTPCLVPLGRFLYFAVNKDFISLDKSTAWVSSLPIDPERIFSVPLQTELSRSIEIPNIGLVRLTRHAISRFYERYCLPRNEPLPAWRAPKLFFSLLSHSGIQKVKLSPQSSLNKLLNHFREANVYARPDLPVAFVVARDEEGLYIPTVVKWNPGTII